jgi:hypothetical protein
MIRHVFITKRTHFRDWKGARDETVARCCRFVSSQGTHKPTRGAHYPAVSSQAALSLSRIRDCDRLNLPPIGASNLASQPAHCGDMSPRCGLSFPPAGAVLLMTIRKHRSINKDRMECQELPARSPVVIRAAVVSGPVRGLARSVGLPPDSGGPCLSPSNRLSGRALLRQAVAPSRVGRT